MKSFIYFIIFSLFILLQCKKDNVPDSDNNDNIDIIVPEIVRHYGGSQMDILYDAIVSTDGGFVLVGSTGYDVNIFVVKTKQNGDTIWTKTIVDSVNTSGLSVKETYDNGYLIIGSPNPFIGKDIIVIKINSNGDILWNKKYKNILSWNGNSLVVQNSDNTFLIAANTGYNVNDGVDVFLLKLNDQGDSIWSNTLTLPDEEVCNSIISTNDGGYAIAGGTELNSSKNILLIKLNSNGILEWSKKFYVRMYNVGNSIIQDQSNNFIILGRVEDANIRSTYLLKTDGQGNKLLEKEYRYKDNECNYGRYISKMIDGSYLITNEVSGFGAFGTLLIKVNSNGDIIWSKYIEHYEGCIAFEASSGKISVMGETMYIGYGSFDLFLAFFSL
ncbi:MAG: hypothetical protein ABIJ97_10985 [Bacteroidota bacterium]